MSSNALYLRIGQGRVLKTLSLDGREKGEVTTGSNHTATTFILTPIGVTTHLPWVTAIFSNIITSPVTSP